MAAAPAASISRTARPGVEGVAEADAAVDDQWDVGAGGDLSGEVGDLSDGEQGFGYGELEAEASAGEVGGFEAEGFDEAGGEGVEGDGCEDGLSGADEVGEVVSVGHGRRLPVVGSGASVRGMIQLIWFFLCWPNREDLFAGKPRIYVTRAAAGLTM